MSDLISREEAMALIRAESDISMQNWKEHDDECSYGEMCAHDRDVDILQSLPSAQPETAKRIVGRSRDGMTLWYQCDMCNEPVDAQDNFCRGCGRRLTDG